MAIFEFVVRLYALLAACLEGMEELPALLLFVYGLTLLRSQRPHHEDGSEMPCSSLFPLFLEGFGAEIGREWWKIRYFFSNFGPNSTTFILPSESFPRELRSSLNGFCALPQATLSIIFACRIS